MSNKNPIADLFKSPALLDNWEIPRNEFKPMLKVDIASGKPVLDNTAKLKELKEGNNDMNRGGRKNSIPAPPKEEMVELIKKHRGKLDCIAKEKGVSWHSARKWVKQYDLDVMAKKQQEVYEYETLEKIVGKQKVTREELTIELADKLAEAGVRQKIIAETFGFSSEISYRNKVVQLRKDDSLQRLGNLKKQVQPEPPAAEPDHIIEDGICQYITKSGKCGQSILESANFSEVRSEIDWCKEQFHAAGIEPPRDFASVCCAKCEVFDKCPEPCAIAVRVTEKPTSQDLQPANPPDQETELKTGIPKPPKELLQKLIDAGANVKEVSRYFGCKLSDVTSWMEEYGLMELDNKPTSTEKEGALIEFNDPTKKTLDFPGLDAAIGYIENSCSKLQSSKLKLFKTRTVVIKEEVPFSFGVVVATGQTS